MLRSGKAAMLMIMMLLIILKIKGIHKHPVHPPKQNDMFANVKSKTDLYTGRQTCSHEERSL
jgi:hypothetical protein